MEIISSLEPTPLLSRKLTDHAGKIIKGIAGFYYVYAEDGNTYECRAKGIFRKDKRKPLVGDNVDITVLDEKNWRKRDRDP